MTQVTSNPPWRYYGPVNDEDRNGWFVYSYESKDEFCDGEMVAFFKDKLDAFQYAAWRNEKADMAKNKG